MRVMQACHEVPGCDLVSFAEVVTRDPFMLVGREPRPGLTLHDLPGLHVATVSKVPTPWQCLQEDLRRAGIAPARLTQATDGTMADNVAALRRGELDLVQVFEPFVSELVADGGGHIWHAAADRGPTSYTTFYARKGLLSGRRDELRRMVRAIHRTQKFVATASGYTIADAIAGYFKDVPPAILAASCARYRSLGIWGGDPHLPRAGYDRLRASLVSAGLVSQGTDYEVAVDNSRADAAIAEDPPPLQ
jgi:NitT/TauT family transport system substrate-binding protein